MPSFVTCTVLGPPTGPHGHPSKAFPSSLPRRNQACHLLPSAPRHGHWEVASWAHSPTATHQTQPNPQALLVTREQGTETASSPGTICTCQALAQQRSKQEQQGKVGEKPAMRPFLLPGQNTLLKVPAGPGHPAIHTGPWHCWSGHGHYGSSRHLTECPPAFACPRPPLKEKPQAPRSCARMSLMLQALAGAHWDSVQ